MRKALGKYIVFIDQDDYYHPGALKEVYEHLQKSDLEILIVDCTYERPGVVNDKLQHGFSHLEVMTGDEQIVRNGLPWAPWKFIFLRSLVIEHQIYFKEEERIEDVDWVHRLIHVGQRVQYQPILFVHYIKNDISTTMTSFFSKETMYSTVRCGRRIYDLAERDFADSSEAVRNRVKSTGIVVYNLGIRNYLFCRDKISAKRKSIKEVVSLNSSNELTGLLKVAVKMPFFYSLFSNAVALISPCLILLRRKWKYGKGKEAFMR